jgi:hypothetical protein
MAVATGRVELQPSLCDPWSLPQGVPMSIRRRPSPGPDDIQCLLCRSTDVKAVSLVTLFAYLRCGGCVEIWSISERRLLARFRRSRLPATLFPDDGPSEP